MNSNITTFTGTSVLDDLMKFYLNISHNGIANMIPYGSFLIAVFGIIDLCTTWALYDGQLKMTMMIQKIFKIGCFVFMVTHWSYLVSIIGRSFSYIGYIAGNHTAAEASTLIGAHVDSEKTMFNPSYILQVCDEVTKPIWASFHETSAFTQFGALLMHLVALALVYVGFYFMVLQLILTNIEFAIFTCLAVILLPFGCLKYTSFLSQRAISGVFSFGIKLMVLYFLLGVISTIGDAFKQGAVLNSTSDKKAAVDYSFLLKQGLAYLTLGYLTWKIPGMAASMMNGTPSLGDGITPGAMIAAPMALAKGTGQLTGNVASFAGSTSTKIGQAWAATKAASMANVGAAVLEANGGGGGGDAITKAVTNTGNGGENGNGGNIVQTGGNSGDNGKNVNSAVAPPSSVYSPSDNKSEGMGESNNNNSIGIPGAAGGGIVTAGAMAAEASKNNATSASDHKAASWDWSQKVNKDEAGKDNTSASNKIPGGAGGGVIPQTALSEKTAATAAANKMPPYAHEATFTKDSDVKAKAAFGIRFAGNLAKQMGITALMVNPIAKGFRRGAQNATQTQDRWDAYKKATTTDGTLMQTLGNRDPSKDNPSNG